MDFDVLIDVKFGDVNSLYPFLLENGLQHQLFRDTLFGQGVTNVPAYPLMDLDPDNLDDWLLAHFVEHNFFSSQLGLSNPVQLLDVDWNQQDSFFDWIATHELLHENVSNALGLH